MGTVVIYKARVNNRMAERQGKRMKLTSECIFCIVRSEEKRLKQIVVPEEKKSLYVKEVLKAVGESGREVSAPVMVAEIHKIRENYFGIGSGGYEQEKHRFNGVMLRIEEQVEKKILEAEDSLSAAMQYARAGNYIDFGALPEVKESILLSILDKAIDKNFSENEVYIRFKKELSTAQKLVYLTDNCGEIVLDKQLIKEIKRLYPKLKVTAVVRGKPVLNDATLEDAEEVGLTKVTEVMENGSDVAGTELSLISAKARKVLEEADLLIAKGQGNYETLSGSGLNIYYLFLCKCRLFVERFHVEQFQGVLLREQQQEKSF